MSFSNLKLIASIPLPRAQAKIVVRQIPYVEEKTYAMVNGKEFLLVRQKDLSSNDFDVFDTEDTKQETALEMVNGVKIRFFIDLEKIVEDGLYQTIGHELL